MVRRPAFADERAQTQQQLDATRQDIAELKKTLGKLQAEKSGVQKDLKATETDIGNLESPRPVGTTRRCSS